MNCISSLISQSDHRPALTWSALAEIEPILRPKIVTETLVTSCWCYLWVKSMFEEPPADFAALGVGFRDGRHAYRHRASAAGKELKK